MRALAGRANKLEITTHALFMITQAESQFRVCVLGSTQFKVADVVALHELCPIEFKYGSMHEMRP